MVGLLHHMELMITSNIKIVTQSMVILNLLLISPSIVQVSYKSSKRFF